jgi:carbon storage regulator
MLVLTRKVGERVIIGGLISIQVLRLDKFAVRLGITAPARLPVLREELITSGEDRTRDSLPKPARSDQEYNI